MTQADSESEPDVSSATQPRGPDGAILEAARTLREAAAGLASEAAGSESARYSRVVRSMDVALRPDCPVAAIAQVSPYVMMTDGTRKTMVAMILETDDPEVDRRRLARVLLRGLAWRLPGRYAPRR